MKKIYKNILSILLVCILVSVSSLTAFAGIASDWKESSVKGYNYKYRSDIWTIYYVSGNTIEGVGIVKSTAGNVPAGYMGVQARLYTSNDTLKYSSAYVYNEIAVINEYAYTSATSSSGYFYSQSQVKLYNGDGYNTYNAYQSPNAAVPTSLDISMDSYGVTRNNETYGSALLAEKIGQEPDLILAVGTDGTEGYVRALDLARTPKTTKDAINIGLMSSQDRDIPLYDLEGNVIGQFMLNAVEKEKVAELELKMK
ncbi:hypothetical protein RBU61_05115 [Tissierella sp. MB52-C2]|uniref:hypothetical protein n=1 Tax=Tissierella sp. MB52-C2 TaxID=3070999 RepID=UPI00280A8533|nr:hypothetical protein [Tissierella sp. MB52-C2]WMM26058.1 hypothetical protein RBU61_05115 [Tissierella sp. MB52-C2]